MRNSLVSELGLDGPIIKLRTSFKKIIIQGIAARQTQANALVNRPPSAGMKSSRFALKASVVMKSNGRLGGLAYRERLTSRLIESMYRSFYQRGA
jgi:hypothetical protein